MAFRSMAVKLEISRQNDHMFIRETRNKQTIARIKTTTTSSTTITTTTTTLIIIIIIIIII